MFLLSFYKTDMFYFVLIVYHIFKSNEEYGLKFLRQKSDSDRLWGESVVLYFIADVSRVESIEELELQLRKIRVEVMIMTRYPNVSVK